MPNTTAGRVAPLLCALVSPAWGAEFHGDLRSRVEMWDWFQGAADNSYAFSGNTLRFGLDQKSRRVDWKVEFAVPILAGLPGGATAPAPQGQLGLGSTYYESNRRSRNAAMVFPKQVYLDLHSPGAGGHRLRLGRFEFADGMERRTKNATIMAVKSSRVQQRLIGTFGFTHVLRSFDGIAYSWDGGAGNVTFVGALPTRGVFQVDGWGWAGAGFGYLAYSRGTGSGASEGELRLFGIYYHDWRPIPKTDNRPGPERNTNPGNVRVGSFGGHYVHALQTAGGTLDFLGWGVGQTGRWGSQDHAAWGFAAEGGWQPPGVPALRPWLRGGWFLSSGDGDPRDDRHETFFQILPTPRVYARFPFHNLMNLEDRFAELVLRPHARVLLRGDIHWLRLNKQEDLWYAGGGAFNPWLFGFVGRPSLGGRGLATLYDVSVDLKATARLTLIGYFGYAAGKSVVRNIYPRDADSRFGYLELSYVF